MSKVQNKGFTKEEELLFARLQQKCVYEILCFILWIHMIDVYSSLILFAVVTALSTYLLAMAYRNTKFTLKHKIAVKREEAVTRDLTKKLADDKKMSKKEKDERILWKKNEVADFQATTFSIFYNNALFLAIVILASFYLLRSFTPAVNYALSIGSTAGLLALLSTGSQ
ncbi:hypothetical protein NQ318_003426 [Aromia moschata]|uniref:Translocon-associated protein subunit gamma n=1 Tax=Aromia moschata TaxID=1265417 RepID=A0AAV8YUZ3_9CUCU|nr:hypothetical protein NQ318_003426 [Aromia moschata]